LRRIIHKVKGWITGTAKTGGEHSALVYVFAQAKGDLHDMPQGDQLAILRRVSSFSDKEEFPITIIFPGRPTRKVPDGSKQGAVVVRYAMPDQLAKIIEQSVRDARKHHSVVLVTDRPDLEKYARRENLRLLRATTLEKAMDAVSGPLRKEQREPREPRDARDGRKPQGEAQPPQPADTQAAPRKPVEPSAKLPQYEPSVPKKETDSSILDLIDPL
jgi:hypothetical protein